MHYFTQKIRLKQAFLCLFLNTTFSTLLMLPLFYKAINDANLPILNTLIMLVSTAFSLNLIAGIIPLAFSFTSFNKTLFEYITILCFSSIQAFLIADVKIFSYFKFHINAIVLNFLFTEGASDSLQLGLTTLFTYFCIILVIFTLQFLFINKLKAEKFPLKKLIFMLFFVFIIDKLTYAYADLKNKTDILTASRFFPLYQKFTAKRILTKYFGIKPSKRIEFNITSNKILNYPLKDVTCKSTKKYNILIIVADGFRHDMLSKEVTPFLYEFANKHIYFENHFSGGNGTRFGIFTLIYGLYGNLWHNFLTARQSPVILDTLQKLDYDFIILSSTRLTYPEFRSTAFIKLQNYIFDTHSEVFAYKRDKILVEKFKDFLNKNDKHFFGFIFFNSSHQFYQYPNEFEKFKPVITGEFNYMKNITPQIMEKLKNRYKNSLFYIDALIKEVITTLKKQNKFDNTIIVITGDHGEEFMENGYFSHTSAFDDYQIKTAMVMHIPGLNNKIISKITSHIDIAPTLLSLIGCNTEPQFYSNGTNIFSNDNKDYTFAFNWYDGAIVTKDFRIIIPLTTEKTGLIEIKTGSDYKNIEDKELLKKYNHALIELSQGLGKFLK